MRAGPRESYREVHQKRLKHNSAASSRGTDRGSWDQMASSRDGWRKIVRRV